MEGGRVRRVAPLPASRAHIPTHTTHNTTHNTTQHNKTQQHTTQHITEMAEAAVSEPTKIGVKLRAENCDIAYPPVVQSGGRFDLKLSAASAPGDLAQEGVILVALGVRYASYCANVAR